MSVFGGEELDVLFFLGDELTLDCFGLADGADIFVWNGKEVSENQIFFLSSQEIRCCL